MTDRNIVSTRTARTFLDSEGICHVEIFNDVEETLTDAQAIVQAARTIMGKPPVPFLIDMRAMKSQDRDARRYYGSDEVLQLTNALALLIESRVSMLIANFFITVTKVSVPTQIFTSEEEAMAWLRRFKQ